MNDLEWAQKVATVNTLTEIAKILLETGAAGPCGYWNQQLATKLVDRAHAITCDIKSAGKRV